MVSEPMKTTAEPFEDFEIMPQGDARELASKLLAEQIGYVMEASPFYRKKLGAKGLGVKEVPHLPFTTKEELREAQAGDPPFGEMRAAPHEDIVRLHLTSGTTGRPLAIGFTRSDHKLSSRIGARSFFAAGVRPTDTVLHCLNYALYVGGVADHLSIEHTGATVVPVGIGQSERILELWEELRPTAIFCTPSYARHLARVAGERGAQPRTLGLRLLLVGGEPGGDVPEIRSELEELWAAEVGDTYGLGEVWPTFAGQCERREGLHLCAGDALWTELVNPASGEAIPLEPGAEGELVYTHLQRQATPLVRYRSGDVAAVVEAGCGCGRRTPRIRLVGRTDSMFIVRGVNVFPGAIEAVLADVLPGQGEFAILVEAPAPTPPVPLLIESERVRPEDVDRVRAAVRERLQFTAEPRIVAPGALGLGTEHKSTRVFRTYLGEWPPGLAERDPQGGNDGG